MKRYSIFLLLFLLLASGCAAKAPAPEETAIRRDLLALLLQTDEERRIAGRIAEGLSVREIAAALGMSKSAVQRRIDHIRNRARLLASA